MKSLVIGIMMTTVVFPSVAEPRNRVGAAAQILIICFDDLTKRSVERNASTTLYKDVMSRFCKYEKYLTKSMSLKRAQELGQDPLDPKILEIADKLIADLERSYVEKFEQEKLGARSDRR